MRTATSSTASWYGLSTLAAYKFTPRFEGVGRFDFIDNSRNGGGLLGYGTSPETASAPMATWDVIPAWSSSTAATRVPTATRCPSA